MSPTPQGEWGTCIAPLSVVGAGGHAPVPDARPWKRTTRIRERGPQHKNPGVTSAL